MIACRSLLFAPANRADVHEKAIASGPDLMCLDLEDAVPADLKDSARKIGVTFLTNTTTGPTRVLRINALRSHEGLRDMEAVLSAAPEQGIVFLPKVQTPGEVDLASDMLTEAAPNLKLAILIETGQGLQAAHEILGASDKIAFTMFGAVDLAADLGVPVAYEPLLYARQRLVHATAIHSVPLIDVPCLSFRDEAAIRQEAQAARTLGFAGKATLHPAGLAPIHEVFTPSPDEVSRAQAIVDAYRASPNGLAKLDGKLIEKPVVRSAERILALSERI